MKKIKIINGPNLNMLGKRNEEHYGLMSLDDINNLILKENNNEFEISFFQSNHEGEIIDEIQNSLDYYAIIINAGAYTHTSLAIHDALEIYKGIIIEVHLSNVDEREDFRKINFIRDLAQITFQGKKEYSYVDAIKYLKAIK